MDAIVIRDLRVEALIGIHRREQHAAQTLSIDLDIGLPGEAVFASDKVSDTIDYEQVSLAIKALAGSGHFRLVETLADVDSEVVSVAEAMQEEVMTVDPSTPIPLVAGWMAVASDAQVGRSFCRRASQRRLPPPTSRVSSGTSSPRSCGSSRRNREGGFAVVRPK